MSEHWADMTAAHDRWDDPAWMQEHMASSWSWLRGHWNDARWMKAHWESMDWMHSGGMVGSVATPGGMMTPSGMMGG